jgi:hypothetical protein
MRNIPISWKYLIIIGFIATEFYRLPSAIAEINFNSKIQDGIEYYIQTDKSVYNLGENVEMLYRITNLSDEFVTFRCPYDPVYQFWAEKDGSQIWSAIDKRYSVIVNLTIVSGASVEFPNYYSPPLLWNMKIHGNYVEPGVYNIVGGLYSAGSFDYTKINVPISIVPEPSSIILLTIGSIGFINKRKKNDS